MKIPWNKLYLYCHLWGAKTTTDAELYSVDGGIKYVFHYPLKNIAEELEAFPELAYTAREKMTSLATEIQEKTKECVVKVAGSPNKWLKIFWKQFYAMQIEKLDKEYRKFELIGKFVIGDRSVQNFDLLLGEAKRVDIVDVVSRFTEVKRTGSSRYMANCLFHQERTPSMVLYPQNNKFHCFGCGKSGDGVDIVMHQMSLGIKDAVALLVGVKVLNLRN